MKRFVVDCQGASSFADFVNAMNDGFIRSVGGEWTGNLDAFNDYLKWPDEGEYQLEIVASARCRAALGHEAMAKWLTEKLLICHPSNTAGVRADLAAAEEARGKTLFEVVCEIIAEHDHVHVILTPDVREQADY